MLIVFHGIELEMSYALTNFYLNFLFKTVFLKKRKLHSLISFCIFYKYSNVFLFFFFFFILTSELTDSDKDPTVLQGKAYCLVHGDSTIKA